MAGPPPSTDLIPPDSHNTPTQERPQTEDWTTFTPPPHLPITHPYLSRYSPSALLSPRPIASNALSTTPAATFGSPAHPLAFAIGNGGAGYTGLLKPLCAQFLWRHGADFRVAWIPNHSRYSQVALLAGLVQVALTYEPEWEGCMEREGWGRVVRPAGEGEGVVFWDHFVLVGPVGDAAGLGGREGWDVRGAMGRIARGGEGVRFFSRGDGSATFTKEQQFWRDVGVDVARVECVQTHAMPPLQALINAEQGGAYMLSDRSTYLTAKRDGVIPNMRVYVEGGKDLLNPCSASVNTKVPDSAGQRMAVRFAEWLGEPTAQGILHGYGRVWEIGLPLFTGKDREEFGDEELLVGREL